MSTPPDLGPLPEPEDVAPFCGQRIYAFTTAQVEAERQRCYMLGVAAASQWRPIESAPPAETDVLVRIVFGAVVRYMVAGYFQAWKDGPCGWYSFEQPEKEIIGVTHWMPLPSDPTKDGG